MGWVWKDDEDDKFSSSSSSRDISDFESSKGDRCSTRKIVKSQCRTEEVEPGKFVRKCEKTEEILRDCVGKPVEVVQSNKEYTEDDVTDEVLKGGSITFGSSDHGVFDFPGLQSDIEAIERNFFGGISRFFEAAEDLKSGFFDAFSRTPYVFDGKPSSSPPSMRRGIPVDEYPRREASPKFKEQESAGVDFSGLAKDV